MDDAKACYLYTTGVDDIISSLQVKCCEGCVEGYDVSRTVAAFSKDLVCSSNYSSENLDGRSG